MGSTGNLPVLFRSLAETVFPGSARALACYFRRLAEMLLFNQRESLARRQRQHARRVRSPESFARHAPKREHEHEDEASAGDERAERIPRFAPFSFALPKFRFEVSKVIGIALYFVQRL